MTKELKFKNPAEKYISKQDTSTAVNTHNTYNADGMQKDETKSKRLNLLVKPSLLADFKKLATMNETSVNDLLNQIMQEYVADNQDTIEIYNDVFKKK